MNDIKKPCVVTIAGSDSSGGAGIQADIKTISALGCYAASVITALTAQNTQGVQSIHPLPAEFIAEQIESVFSDLDVVAVKIGMLFQKDIIDAVAYALKKFKPYSIVIDPVMVAKSGAELLPSHIIDYLQQQLFSIATLITPNILEAQKLLQITNINSHNLPEAAEQIARKFQTNVLVKGGHVNSKIASDVLYSYRTNTHTWFHHPRIQTIHTHGTGCTLSAAIASYLAKNNSLIDSISHAKQYLSRAIQAGSTLAIGKGFGPVDHFYLLEQS